MMDYSEKIERQQRRSEREKQRRRYESSHEERTMEPETKNGIVANCALLNFRRTSRRRDDHNIIDTLKKGERIKILYETESEDSPGVKMLKVQLMDGREGFIVSDFCQEV